MDLVIILDSSVKPERDFKQMKAFAKAVIEKQDIRPNATRIGLIAFDYYAYDRFSLAPHWGSTELEDKLDELETGGTNSYYDTALWLLLYELFLPKNTRPGIAHMSLFVTDSPDSRRWLSRTYAQRITQSGIGMVAVGIGLDNFDDIEYLAQMTGDFSLVVDVPEPEKLLYYTDSVTTLIKEQGLYSPSAETWY